MQTRAPHPTISPPQSLSRRGLIQSAAAWVHLGAIGLGTCNFLSPRQADAGTINSATAAKSKTAKSCILLWLDGGPSHLEMFDPKPEAPVEVRGAYQSIATSVPGIRIGEWLPRTSLVCDKLAILRSVTSPLGEHGLANRYLLTGYKPAAVEYPGWDTHENLRLALRDGYSGAKEGVGLIPTFDQAYSALIEDLSQSGLLDETLVVVMGEFGRTPKLNTRGGRDHWPRVFSVVMAGGGVRGGQTIGESDRIGESPRSHPITPADLAYSIYRLLGIDPDQELLTPEGRPIPLVQGGKWIPQLA